MVNAALYLNSGKYRLTTPPALEGQNGSRCARCGISVKKYLGEIERQINARANAHREYVVFSRELPADENPAG